MLELKRKDNKWENVILTIYHLMKWRGINYDYELSDMR